jgi:hypothetical protein
VDISAARRQKKERLITPDPQPKAQGLGLRALVYEETIYHDDRFLLELKAPTLTTDTAAYLRKSQPFQLRSGTVGGRVNSELGRYTAILISNWNMGSRMARRFDTANNVLTEYSQSKRRQEGLAKTVR